MTAPVPTAASSRSWTLRRRIGRMFIVAGRGGRRPPRLIVVSTVEFIAAGNDVIYTLGSGERPHASRSLVDLVDQETGVRGYALTRDQTFLARYRTAARSRTSDLRRLTSNSARTRRVVVSSGGATGAGPRLAAEIAEPAVTGIAAGHGQAIQLAEGDRAEPVRPGPGHAAAARRPGVESNGRRRSPPAARDFLAVFVVALVVSVASDRGRLPLWRGLRRWVLRPIDRLGSQTRLVAGGRDYREISAEGPVEFTELGGDVEAMRLQIASQLARAREAQEELRLQGEELARSNDDLQQFAYVASHDLSEPLRKVANFCQLLERQYGPQLDDRARQYIDFAVDGAKRMQRADHRPARPVAGRPDDRSVRSRRTGRRPRRGAGDPGRPARRRRRARSSG